MPGFEFTTRTNQVDTKRAPGRILSDKDTWANLRSRPATSNHDMLRCHPRDPAMIARTRAGSAVIAGELLGITDIIECADGNKAGCLWLVAMIPIAKPLKVLNAGKIAEATATAAKTAEAAAEGARGGTRLLAPPLTIPKAQFGKKWGKHAGDYGLDPRDPGAREWFENRIREVHHKPDEVRRGPWNPGRGGREDYFFFRQGEDLVVTKPGGQFVSMFPGKENGWFQNAQVFHR